METPQSAPEAPTSTGKPICVRCKKEIEGKVYFQDGYIHRGCAQSSPPPEMDREVVRQIARRPGANPTVKEKIEFQRKAQLRAGFQLSCLKMMQLGAARRKEKKQLVSILEKLPSNNEITVIPIDLPSLPHSDE